MADRHDCLVRLHLEHDRIFVIVFEVHLLRNRRFLLALDLVRLERSCDKHSRESILVLVQSFLLLSLSVSLGVLLQPDVGISLLDIFKHILLLA